MMDEDESKTPMIRHNAAGLGEYRGERKLKNRGGPGQEGVGIIDGSVMTIQETAAVAVARDVIDDAERHHKKGVADLSLMELAPFARGRAEGRSFSDGQLLAEICRLQNFAIYGSKVARRT